MSSTDPGPRDHLVTGPLASELSGLSDDVRLEQPLDAAEAPERLARHAMEELRRGLGADDEPSDRQARRVNDVLRQLASGDGAPAEVALPARVLHGIRGRRGCEGRRGQPRSYLGISSSADSRASTSSRSRHAPWAEAVDPTGIPATASSGRRCSSRSRARLASR